MKRYLFIVIFALCCVTACSNTKVSEVESSEVDVMKIREVCKVLDDKDYFVLENTKGEVYRLDISCKGEYKTGDGVILVYTQRQEIEEGVYEAEVFAIHDDSDKLEKPM